MEPNAKTAAGELRGRVDGDVLSFKGIPYAAPPTGPLRFRSPEPAPAWAGVVDAFEYGPSCPQSSARPQGWSQEPSLSEDCLYLNVWTPGLNRSARRPVMVWLHGGGFSIGSGSWPVYDGQALASRGDVVVVTVNHRLGIFGYLHLGDRAGSEYASSGNAGMLDLVAALRWVNENIAAFGGDPDNVTIFGESGGGAKVSTLLAMPAAAGLFHRAAIQSGPGLRVRAEDQATQSGEEIAVSLGCSAGDVGALQSLPSERLLEAQAKRGRMSFTDFSPVLDGIAVTDHPGQALSNGTASDVPIIVGSNRDEASLFLAMDPANADLASLDESGLMRRMSRYGDDGPRIAAEYRAARPDASPYDLYVAIESDRMMRAPSIELAERKLGGGTAPVFMYLFRWATGPLGSAHGYEIAFVFDNARPPVMHPSPSRAALAAQMSDAWISFARVGDPSHGGLPAWPAYSTAERATMIFDRDDCHVERDPCPEGRLAWAGTKVRTGMAL